MTLRHLGLWGLRFSCFLWPTVAFSACCPGLAFVFRVSSPTADVYRIEVQPASGSATTDVTSVRSDTTALRLDPGKGRIDIVRFDAPGQAIAWSGTLSPIASFGRASVPGIELAWTALGDEAIYGTGERFDTLNQNGRKVEIWNRDAPAQGGGATYYGTPTLYSSAGYGLFFTNNPEAVIDFNTDHGGLHHYQRAGTSITFYVSIKPSLKDLLRARAALQGPYRDVPDWAWGPWISRNSFENQAEAEEAIHGMLDRNFPVAAIVQEAWKGSSETGEFNSFSKTRWPDLPRFLALCKEHGIRNVLWQVPIVHPSCPGFAEAAKAGYFVRRADGSVSFRQEWLAGFANIDFTNPKAREYWKNQMRETVRLGIAGFKADDGEAIQPDDVFFDGRRGWELHNEYSTLYNRTLTELLDEEHADGMLWSRSGSLGNETCPALWAGDQDASWDQLRSLLPAGLSASISGMPFWGHDIGGYMGQPSPELYVRWLQFGAFSPLMQYHGVRRREPWEFGPEAEAAYKLLSHLRMNLKPALIALGHEAAATGMPIIRPMALEFPDDPRFASEQTQYMLGPDLLVAPVLDSAPGRRVKFPAGRWRHLLRPIAFDGPGEAYVPVGFADAPVFVRDGATLSVQLAEGAKLGTWIADAPVRAVTFKVDSTCRLNPSFAPPEPLSWQLAGPFGPDAWIDVNASSTTWTRARSSIDPQGTLDLGTDLNHASNCCAYARSVVLSPQDKPVNLVCGSDDGLVVWWNGAMVISNNVMRPFSAGSDTARAVLKAGSNALCCRVSQGGGEWKLRVEVRPVD